MNFLIDDQEKFDKLYDTQQIAQPTNGVSSSVVVIGDS